jgi:hypothetical protein
VDDDEKAVVLASTVPVVFDNKHVEYLPGDTKVDWPTLEHHHYLLSSYRRPQWTQSLEIEAMLLEDGRRIFIEGWGDEILRLRQEKAR